MGCYQSGDRVRIQVIEGQISIYEHETQLSVRNAVGEIHRQIPLMEMDEETLKLFPYLEHAEAYEVDVEGKIFGALGWPPVDGDNYDVSDGLMYIAVLTKQIPSLIQGLVQE